MSASAMPERVPAPVQCGSQTREIRSRGKVGTALRKIELNSRQLNPRERGFADLP